MLGIVTGKRFSLSARVTIALACGLALVSVTLTVMQYRVNSRLLTNEWETKSLELARMLKVVAKPLLEHGDYRPLREAVTQAGATPGIKTLTVVNAQGTIVADSFERDVGERLKLHLDAVRQALNETHSDPLSWIETTGSGRVHYILSTIKGPSHDSPRPEPVLGALLLGVDLSIMDALIKSNLRYLLFVNVMTFTALLIMFWLAIRIGLIQPLAALNQTIRSVPGAPPLSTEPVKTADEIGMLSETFTRMTEALDESETFNRAVLGSVIWPTAVLDKAGHLLTVNPAWEEAAKRSGGSLPHTGGGIVNYLDACRQSPGLYGNKTREAVAGMEAVLAGSSPVFTLEYQCSFDEGGWFMLAVTPLRRENGGAVVTHIDISDQKRTTYALQETLTGAEKHRASLDALYATIPLALLYVDAELRVGRMTKAMSDLSGQPPEEQVGRSLSLVLPGGLWDRLQPVLEDVLKTGKAQGGVEETIEDSGAPGEQRHLVCDCYPELAQDGTVRGVHMLFRDVTTQKQTEQDYERKVEELKMKNRELDQMAIRDPLTGLYNRRFFDEALSREWQQFQRTGEAFTVIIMDVDAFKSINDQYGHETGDRALLQVAIMLRTTLRESDLVARIGGDEFAALLPRTDTERCGPVTEKLREVLRKLRLRTTGGLIPISLSIGAATVPGFPPVSSAAELLRVADKRMYDAKRLASSGRTDPG